MRRHRKVKIVATLGPASSDFATIRALFEAGADVFNIVRVNVERDFVDIPVFVDFED